MATLSKSKYTSFHQCPKKLWMDVYKPEEAKQDDALDSRMSVGTDIGILAQKLFGEPQSAVVTKDDGTPDLSRMIKLTQKLLDNNAPIVVEAAFEHDGCYCAVDILKNTGLHEYTIYEVKSTSHAPGDEKDVEKKVAAYLPDVAYQTYVLRSLGYTVSGVNLVLLNAEYTLPESKEIVLSDLFTVVNIDKYITEPLMMDTVSKIEQAKKVLDSEVEWETELHLNCKKPYDCPFIDYCMKKRGIKYPSVFNLYRAQWKKKLEYLNNGIVTFDDVWNNVKLSSETQKMQVECTMKDVAHVDYVGIDKFLNTLTYPLYYLDFETVQPAVPEYVGTHPYQQVPFQYSLHIKDNPDAELRHEEFLGNPDEDPRRPLAESLVKNIPNDVCVLAYNKSFECGRIKELAQMYPDLAEHLLCIERNIIDLMDPFVHCCYYLPSMKDSFSIKSVLPALFPDSKELNYHNLNESVQNGAMAMNAFPAMKQMNESERQVIRKALLDYCCLDTLAMVRVHEELRRVSSEHNN